MCYVAGEAFFFIGVPGQSQYSSTTNTLHTNSKVTMSRRVQDPTQQPSRSRSPTNVARSTAPGSGTRNRSNEQRRMPSQYGSQSMYPAAPPTNAGIFSTSNPGHSYPSGDGMNQPSQYENQYMVSTQHLPSSGGTERQAYSYPDQRIASVTYLQGLSNLGFATTQQGPGAFGYDRNQGYVNLTTDPFDQVAPMQFPLTAPNQYNMPQFLNVDGGSSGQNIYETSFYSTLPGNQSQLMPIFGTQSPNTFAQTMQQPSTPAPQSYTASALQANFPNTDSFEYTGQANTAAPLHSGLELSGVQSTRNLTRKCDRCHQNGSVCSLRRMPCRRCREDGVECTENRPLHKSRVKEPPTNNTGPSFAPASMSQLPTSNAAVPLAHKFDLSSIQSLKKLTPPCDRCYSEGWPCHNKRTPCTRCKADQVICTDHRPRGKGR